MGSASQKYRKIDMLIEKFDFLELLRLAIAQSNGKGKITKDVVLGEIAFTWTFIH